MLEITEEQLKAGLSAIKFRYANLRQPDQRTPIRATQREALAKLFRYGIDGRRKALEQLATLPPRSTTTVITLPTPILILPTRYLPDGGTEASPILIDSHIEPLNNWAKIILNYAGDPYRGIDVLYFYFQWQNETGSAAIVNVRSDVWLNGSCYVHANNAPNVVVVDAVLHVLEWWNQPPTEPLWESSQSQNAAWVTVTGGLFSADGKSELISEGHSLTYNYFLVPRGSVAVFEVGVRLFYVVDNAKLTSILLLTISQCCVLICNSTFRLSSSSDSSRTGEDSGSQRMQCPLWVISRHTDKSALVRFTPNNGRWAAHPSQHLAVGL